MLFVYLGAVLLAGEIMWKTPINRIRFEKATFKSPIFLFLAAITISFLFSTDKNTSFYGYYTRFNGGLLSIISYIIIFVTVIRISVTKEKKGKIVNIMLLSSFVVSLYAIAQHFGIDEKYWVQNVKLRVFSTLGQPNWLASWLIMIIPLTLYQALSAKNNSYNAYGGYKYYILFLLQFTAFWFTYSLSGIVGLVAALIIFAIFSRKLILNNIKKALIFPVIMLMVVLIFPGPVGERLKNTKDQLTTRLTIQVKAQETQEAEKLTPVNRPTNDTTSIRLILWKGTLKLWLSSPKLFLIGSGPETFAYSFLPFRPEQLNNTSEWDFLYNKAHNEYLNMLATTGILGLVSYLAILKIALKRQEEDLSSALAAGLVGVSIAVFFGFHVVTTNLYSWIFLAVLWKREKVV